MPGSQPRRYYEPRLRTHITNAMQTIAIRSAGRMDCSKNHYNRVDTCIPEEEAFRRLQKHIHKIWKDANDKGERYFPHEFMYKIFAERRWAMY